MAPASERSAKPKTATLGVTRLAKPSAWSRVALARIAGVLYLALVVLGVFAHLFVRASVHVPGDAAATADRIAEAATAFRLALVADVAMAMVFVGLGLALWALLGHAGRRWAIAMMIFVAVGAGMTLVNLVFHYAALLVATDPTALGAFGGGDADALVLLLVDLHEAGYVIAGVFFGLWLFPLGLIARRSGLFPPALGVLLVVSCGIYLVDTVLWFLTPDLDALAHELLTAPTAIAEFWMAGYLLVRGVRQPRRDEPAEAAEPVLV